MTPTPRPRNRELDVTGILVICKEVVPVNCHVDTAIAAHRIAFAQFAMKGDEAETLAMHTLRAVVLAMTPACGDSQTMFDYLSGLPLDAWCATEGCSAEQVREETLAAISRSIAWGQQN